MDTRISTNELIDILIAYVVLTIAFGIVFTGGLLGGGSLQSLNADYFVIAAIGVGTGFLLHEMAHKFVAIRYGYHAEFKADMNGLFLTIIMSVLGFIIAMPRAVMIYGRAYNQGGYTEAGAGSMDDDAYWDRLSSHSRINRPELYISIAGVVMNLILAAFFIMLLRGHFVPWHENYFGTIFFDSILAQAAYYGLTINIVLAAFNMIPFGPLDGAKVLRANPLVWAIIGLPVIFFWLFLMFGQGGSILALLIGA